MGKLLRIFVAVAIVAGTVVGAYALFRSRESENGGPKLVEASRGAITEKAVAVGQIQPRLKYQVKSKISGIVRNCQVQVGDRVEPGDPLFEIEPDPTPNERIDAERRVELSEATFRRAEADWARARELAASGILSREEHDAARQAYEEARIHLAQARDSLELLRRGRVSARGSTLESVVRAPAAGTVLSRLVDPGDPVVPLTTYQAGTELATVADMTDLIFKGTVDEIDVGKLRAGLPARLKIGALPDAVVTGRLTRIAPQAIEKDNARLFEVEIELDPQGDVLLRAGYSANADLVIREKNDVVLIPERLVLFEEDGARTFVEVPGGDPAAEPRKVEIHTGLSDGLNIEVIDGLADGDPVIERPPREIIG